MNQARFLRKRKEICYFFIKRVQLEFQIGCNIRQLVFYTVCINFVMEIQHIMWTYWNAKLKTGLHSWVQNSSIFIRFKSKYHGNQNFYLGSTDHHSIHLILDLCPSTSRIIKTQWSIKMYLGMPYLSLLPRIVLNINQRWYMYIENSFHLFIYIVLNA